MKDPEDEDSPDYGPNELARLSIEHHSKYLRIINASLEDGDSVERWQQRNMQRAKEDLAWQRRNRN